MRVLIIAVVFVVMCFKDFAFGAKIDTECKKWECQSGIGGSETSTNRTCAKLKDTKYGIEECQPTGFLCPAELSLSSEQKCANNTVLPWKKDMPAGDSCTMNDECFTRKCNVTGNTHTCSGKTEGTQCGDDRECYPGLYCNKTLVCGKVANSTTTCSDDVRCGFGQTCVNGTCTKYGTLKDGTAFYLLDILRWTDPFTLTTSMYWVCENFYAYNTGVKANSNKNPVLVCGSAPEKNFTSYKRSKGDDNMCSYTFQFANGTKGNYTYPATCGYNHDGAYYCPKFRGKDEYDVQNSNDRALWKDLNVSCHHRSTMQYCRGVEDNVVVSQLMRFFMQTDYETTGNGYPYIANNDRCTGNAMVNTRNYWRIIDSAQGTVMTYFALVIGFISLAYLY